MGAVRGFPLLTFWFDSSSWTGQRRRAAHDLQGHADIGNLPHLYADPREIEAADRSPRQRQRRVGDQRLHLGEQRTLTLYRDRDCGAGDRFSAPIQKEIRGIRHRDDARIMQLEAPYLIGWPKP